MTEATDSGILEQDKSAEGVANNESPALREEAQPIVVGGRYFRPGDPRPPQQVVPMSTLIVCSLAIALFTAIIVGVIMRPPSTSTATPSASPAQGQVASASTGLPKANGGGPQHREPATAQQPPAKEAAFPPAAPSRTRRNAQPVPPRPAAQAPNGPPYATNPHPAGPQPYPNGGQPNANPHNPGAPPAPAPQPIAVQPGRAPVPSAAPPAATPQPSPWSDRARPPQATPTPARDKDSDKVIVIMGAVEQTGTSCIPWFMIYSNTNSRYDVYSHSVNLRDMNGHLCDRTGTQRQGAITINPHECAYFWPAFLQNNGASASELTLDIKGYGQITVPAQEKMTNLGAFDSLSEAIRDRTRSLMRQDATFRWWENPTGRPRGM